MPAYLPSIPVPYGNANCSRTVGTRERSMQNKNIHSVRFIDNLDHAQTIEQISGLMKPSLEDVSHQEIEGDYVDLLDIAASAEHIYSSCPPEMGDPPVANGDSVLSITTNNNKKWICGRVLTSKEGACTPCLRRRFNKGLDAQETKCHFRQSYLAALKNPVSFSSVPMANILEDPLSRAQLSTTFAALESPLCSRRKNQAHLPSNKLLPGKAETNRTGDMSSQSTSRNPKPNTTPGLEPSPSLVHRLSFLRGQRSCSSPGDGIAMDANANQYGGTWRRVSAVCSPRLSRSKFCGKATAANGNSGLEVTSTVQKVPSKAGLWVSIVGSPVKVIVPSENIQDPPIQCQDLSAKLLYSGIACLPGSRDKLGRAVIQVTTDSTSWDAPWCSTREVARLLLYLCSISRKEVKDLGMLILVDARKQAPSPCLHAALHSVQASFPGSIQSILILLEKETASQLDKIPGLQVEVLTSPKALSRYVEIGQLTWDLGGTFPYCHSEWVQFYQKLDAFLSDLRKASDLLQNSIQELGEGSSPQDSREVEEKMAQHRDLMKVVLSDSHLVSLQREGGTTLARLRKEAMRFCCSQDVRSAVEAAVHLYNQLEEQVHALVTKSNRRLELLESLLKIRELESQFNQLSSWMDGDGENQLHEMDTMEWSLDILEQYRKKFKDFFLQATVHYNHGLVLLDDANKFSRSHFPEMESFKVARSSFQARLTSFYMCVERQKEELEKLMNLYKFCDKISQLTVSCSRYLGQLKKSEQKLCLPETRQCLESYLLRLTDELSADKFQEMKEESYSLSSSRGLTVWNETWLRCQESRQLLEETLEKCKEEQRTDIAGWHKDTSGSSNLKKQSENTPAGISNEVLPKNRRGEEEFRPRGSTRTAETTVINCCSFGLHAGSVGLFLKASRSNRNRRPAREPVTSKGCSTNEESRSSSDADPEHTELMVQNSNNEALEILHSPTPTLSRKTPVQSLCASKEDHLGWLALGRFLSDDTSTISRGDSGRAIMQPGRRCPLSRHASFSTGDSGSQYSSESSSLISPLLAMEPLTPRMPWTRGTISESSQESDWSMKANFAKMHKIMEELLTTERDYVCSLGYVLSHYLSEMDRPDVPPTLRGQHAAIFGNLEKLYEFHSHVFLQELTSCRREPSLVGGCFLKHKDQFGLYAFYSKNKPQSDRLLQDYGAAFFKRKQQELNDKMDLSSYLLKPIQRISKYSLLLQDLEWELKGQSTRQAELQAAREVVHFQLRHGNDLLAMDAIQDCDVNLKEQGRLLRQGEFMISYKKKKCCRRVFLFEDLILFSKAKKSSSGIEVYMYKQSFKTSEIGLTHSLGGSGLCFEIWFRRRKLEDTYTLQALSAEVKEAWTGDLQKILWDQAIKNRDDNLRSSPVVTLPFPTSPAPLRSMSVGSRSSAVSLGGCSSTSSGRGSLSPHHCCPSSEPSWRSYKTESPQEREAGVFLTASSGSSEGSVSGLSSSVPNHFPLGHKNTCYPSDCWRPLHTTEKPPGNNIP
ncbi:pleckstrin homology domain-containing family G member 4B-like [Xenopus laevis]|uniref:Pleckstrin homology domain-containing family G member 4B-like n=1 Tax=Xenopus laevis TaxID=8355 RepID=A0A8J1LYG5_XENLA|nr:pleckstrin homology domain-containing family G member 4B-like [Xenopus laevis]XP_018093883.1 pleckstrin homology domain-containing family G member 4B-like [Xenopus laevis]XP_018093884.1 pleckstrin homology domain-containing family G member 4B-like [Xenopus laevis]XP_041434449.1 pleckstrin homology domain-containing family G member 4B-like [Xenopus laevis]